MLVVKLLVIFQLEFDKQDKSPIVLHSYWLSHFFRTSYIYLYLKSFRLKDFPFEKLTKISGCSSEMVHICPYVSKTKMSLRDNKYFQFSKVCLHFSAVCLQFVK